MRRGTLCALWILSTPALPASEGAWTDVEARIQYGYFVEDRRALEGLAGELGAGGEPEELRSYFAGLAQYRLALIAGPDERDRGRQAAQRCTEHLEPIARGENASAEALALHGACLGLLSALRPWPTPLTGSRSQSQLARAVKLAPRNPRVLLLDALGDYDRAAPADRERALAKLRRAVEAFERERQGIAPVPSWGAAEAYAFLARSLLDRGDTIGAREAIERALLIAPEFAFARRLMSRIIGG